MILKIKKISMNTSIIVVALLFACNSGSRPPSLSDLQRLQVSSEVTDTAVTEEIIEDDTNNAVADTDEYEPPRNTHWADAEGNPTHRLFDVYGRRHTHNFFHLDERPLFNGKNFVEEFRKYISENNKFEEIIEKHNIQRGNYSFEILIDTDGLVYTNLVHKLR